MAKANNTTALFSSFIFILLSLLLIIVMAESRTLGVGVAKKTPGGPHCVSVYNVRSGDTCFGITKKLNLNTYTFDSINPNLNCDILFVGQWICVAGTPN